MKKKKREQARIPVKELSLLMTRLAIEDKEAFSVLLQFASQSQRPKMEKEEIRALAKVCAPDDGTWIGTAQDAFVNGFIHGQNYPPSPEKEREVSVEQMLDDIARLEHEQWMDWSHSIIEQILQNPTDSAEQIRDRVLKIHQRWLKFWKDYDELTTGEKAPDKIYAKKIVAYIRSVSPSITGEREEK